MIITSNVVKTSSLINCQKTYYEVMIQEQPSALQTNFKNINLNP